MTDKEQQMHDILLKYIMEGDEPIHKPSELLIWFKMHIKSSKLIDELNEFSQNLKKYNEILESDIKDQLTHLQKVNAMKNDLAESRDRLMLKNAELIKQNKRYKDLLIFWIILGTTSTIIGFIEWITH